MHHMENQKTSKTPWKSNWDKVDAVWRLFFEKAAPPHKMPEGWGRQVVIEAFEQRYPRFADDHQRKLKPLKDKLQALVGKLSQQLKAKNLTEDVLLPPVVWIRLLRLAHLEPEEAAMRRFERWQEKRREQGKVILYMYAKDSKYAGKELMQLFDGLGKVQGYSVEDLLGKTMQNKPNWPFCRQWVCVVKAQRKKATLSATTTPLEVDTAGKAPIKTAIKKSVKVAKALAQDAVPTQKQRRKRKRSLAAVQRACGSRVVHALEQCLAMESGRRSTVLEVGGRNNRDYDCQLSLDELVAVLKKKFTSQLDYSDSTLKSALSYFVSCPRGRPGGLFLL